MGQECLGIFRHQPSVELFSFLAFFLQIYEGRQGLLFLQVLQFQRHQIVLLFHELP